MEKEKFDKAYELKTRIKFYKDIKKRILELKKSKDFNSFVFDNKLFRHGTCCLEQDREKYFKIFDKSIIFILHDISLTLNDSIDELERRIKEL